MLQTYTRTQAQSLPQRNEDIIGYIIHSDNKAQWSYTIKSSWLNYLIGLTPTTESILQPPDHKYKIWACVCTEAVTGSASFQGAPPFPCPLLSHPSTEAAYDVMLLLLIEQPPLLPFFFHIFLPSPIRSASAGADLTGGDSSCGCMRAVPA